MFEKQPNFNVEHGEILNQAINGATSIENVVKILEESVVEEIQDPNGNFYYKENIIADLRDLEETVTNLSEDEINSEETHTTIVGYLNLLPNNYSLRQHTLRLLPSINPLMKKFIF